MSHNLYINKFRKASFASAREIPWHGLGQIVEGAMTSDEALELAGLNYEVAKAPALALIDKGGMPDGSDVVKEVDKTYITYRTDTLETFGPVGEKYEIVQNIDAFAFFDGIVGAGEAIYETAGAIGKGETVFITAKLPGHINVPGELIEKYLLFRLTHDAKEALNIGFTPVRVVCNNTLNWAMLQGLEGGPQNKGVKIRHTASAHDKLRTAQEMLGIANMLTDELGEIWTTMKKQSIVDKDVQDLFMKLILTKDEIEEKSPISQQKVNTLDDMYEYYLVGVGQESIVGTKFGAYNAVSGYYQNAKASTNPENLIKSNLFGYNGEKVKTAMKLLMN